MATNCGDTLSLQDLQTAKKHQIFEAEVITGKQGGVAGGADIDYATNQVTGQVQKTLPAVLRDLGFDPATFDFTTGGTLTVNDRNKVVYDPVSKTWYSWSGALPKVIPAATNPAGAADWIPQTDPNLRSDITGPNGYAMVGGLIDAIVTSGSGGNVSDYVQLATGVNTTGKKYAWYGAKILVLNFSGVVNTITQDTGGVYHFNDSANEDALEYEKYKQRQNGLVLGWGDVENESALRKAVIASTKSGQEVYANIGDNLAAAVPEITMSATLEIPKSAALRLGRTKLLFPANITNAILLTSDGLSSLIVRCPLEGGSIIAGDPSRNSTAGITAGVGIQWNTNHTEIKNVDIRGFTNAEKIGNDTWWITRHSCSYWYNLITLDMNASALTNTGAGHSWNKCVFAWNNYNVLNQLCELTFNDCAFDQFYKRVVMQNINSTSGVFQSQMIFNNCRFEADKAGAEPWFKTDEGIMVLNNPAFYGPFNASLIFDGTGEVYITGGVNQFPADKVLCEEFTKMNVVNHHPIARSQVTKWKSASITWYNSTMSNGTAGYSAEAGTLTVGTGAAALSGNSLKFKYAGGTSEVTLRGPMISVAGRNNIAGEFYSKGGSGPVTHRIDIYSGDVVISTVDAVIAAVSATYVKRTYNIDIPPSATGVRLKVAVGSSFTTDLEMSDFEISTF